MMPRDGFIEELRDVTQSVFRDADVYPFGVTPRASNARRYVTYQQVGSEHMRHLGGGSGLANPSMRVTAWTQDPDDGELLADAIRTRLDNRRGTVGDKSKGVVKSVTLESQRGVVLPPEEKGEPILWFGQEMDFSIWHEETLTPVPANSA